MVKRYVPKIGNAAWDVRQMSKEQLLEIKKRLVVCEVCTHEEYQSVIGYLYSKFPQEHDGVRWKETMPDGSVVTHEADTAIQWKYAVPKHALAIKRACDVKEQSMYAFIVYDPERDWEPVAYAGSYFGLQELNQDLGWTSTQLKHYACDSDGNINPNGSYMRTGMGIVMFIDPSYRRMGLATDLWWSEANLYRDTFDIRVQREIQNTFSLKSTQRMFSDPSKCVITSPGRLKNDGTRCQIRCLLDYEDIDVKKGWITMLPNMKEIRPAGNFHFMKREQLRTSDLCKPWNGDVD